MYLDGTSYRYLRYLPQKVCKYLQSAAFGSYYEASGVILMKLHWIEMTFSVEKSKSMRLGEVNELFASYSCMVFGANKLRVIKIFTKKKLFSYDLCLTLSFGNPYWKYVQFKTAIIDNILQWNTWFLRFVCQSYLYRIRIECIMSYNRGWNYLDTIFYLDLLAVKKELICQCWPIFVVLSIVLGIFGNAMSLKKEEILWPTNPAFVLW